MYKRQGDIIVSQDYGVAAMVLGKGAYAIHQSGKWYTNENIDQMLMERHLNLSLIHIFSMDCFWAEVTAGHLELKEAEAAKWLTNFLYQSDICR